MVEIIMNVSTWTDNSTKLLTWYEQFSPLVGKSIKLKTKSKIWKAIAEEMVKEGYKFTNEQIENRFKLRRHCGLEPEINSEIVDDPDLVPGHSNQSFYLSSPTSPVPSHSSQSTSGMCPAPSPRPNHNQKPNKTRVLADELMKLRAQRQVHHEERIKAYQERAAQIKQHNKLLQKLIEKL